MTPPRNPPVYYNNSSYSQPSMMARDGTLNNPGSGANPNNTNAYLSDLHSHSVQNKFSHVREFNRKTFFSRLNERHKIEYHRIRVEIIHYVLYAIEYIVQVRKP
jgi:hypothetical protein